MLRTRFLKGYDQRRLRLLLALLFLALAVPTIVLIWQGYRQLKWEAFHQYRGVAEELTGRIDARLFEMINAVDARSFADYAFLVVSGDPSANFVQRSPLSAYPVQEDLPGIIGYFQIDPDGTFSTPLLPPRSTAARDLGIDDVEYADRLQLAREIQTVLADNRLVRSRPDSISPHRAAAVPQTVPEDEGPARVERPGAVQSREADEQTLADSGSGSLASNEVGLTGGRRGDDAVLDSASSEADAPASAAYSQRMFDQLSRLRKDAAIVSGEPTRTAVDGAEEQERFERQGKVSGLALDQDLDEKSAQAERRRDNRAPFDDYRADALSRTKRREQIALPEAAEFNRTGAPVNVPGPTDLRINTFESEVDPFEFSLLDSGHFVLFRRVWRDSARYIQGVLVDPARFTSDVIGEPFTGTTLAGMSRLIVAYQNDVIRTFNGREGTHYPDVAENLSGTLLYRGRLTTPLNGLELIYSIQSLPPGPGASVLRWVTLVLAIVFIAGFVALYRLGSSQIELARQQQDFVSAVSHELKTPLTSIRMYGEMLKQGWVSEEKRQAYYEYIHDESERLSRLISNVLQLARITRNEPRFDPKVVKVGALLDSVESKISAQIERAGFRLRTARTDEADQAEISVDEDCFMQIIINLVDNAIKFSKGASAKAIELGSSCDADGRVSISVRDFGPGIARDQRKKIFQLFYRSESELTRETVGTGIGLAIVHQLTTAMRGSVDLVNAEPGAEFRVSFARIG